MTDDNAPTTRIAQLARELRRMPLGRQLIPMEAGLGWPIPIAAGEKAYVKFVFFGYQPVRGKDVTALVFPPSHTVTLDWVTGRPVEFVNLRYRNPDPQLDWTSQAGTFPHEAVGDSKSQYVANRQRAYELYDRLLNATAEGTPFPDDETAELSTLLRTLVEPDLLPYYAAIGPAFSQNFLGATP